MIDKLQMTIAGVNRHPALTKNTALGGPAEAGHAVGSGWVDDPSYHWIVVNVSFTNLPGATADEDVGTTGSLDAFTVVGTDGLVVGPQVDFSNSCPNWSATIAQTGGSYGPKPLCFSVGGNVNGPITLRWTHGFSGTQEVALAP